MGIINTSSTESIMNATVVDALHLELSLYENNGIPNETLLSIISRFKNYSTHLTRLATSLERSNTSSDKPPKFHNISDNYLLLEIYQNINRVLPISTILLNHDEVPISYPAVLKEVIDSDELSWLSAINFFMNQLRRTESGLLDSWSLRLQKASVILYDIYHLNMLQWNSISKQTAREFIMSCSCFNNDICDVAPIETEYGHCFRIFTKSNCSGLKFVLNLDKYEAIQLFRNELSVKMFLGIPDDQNYNFNSEYLFYPGRLYEIGIHSQENLNRLYTQCGEKKLNNFDYYSYDACKWEQRSMLNYEICGCATTDSALLRTNRSGIKICTFLETHKCYFLISKSSHLYSSKEKTSNINSGCPRNCVDTKYNLEFSSSVITDGFLEKTSLKTSEWFHSGKHLFRPNVQPMRFLQAKFFSLRQRLLDMDYDIRAIASAYLHYLNDSTLDLCRFENKTSTFFKSFNKQCIPSSLNQSYHAVNYYSRLNNTRKTIEPTFDDSMMFYHAYVDQILDALSFPWMKYITQEIVEMMEDTTTVKDFIPNYHESGLNFLLPGNTANGMELHRKFRMYSYDDKRLWFHHLGFRFLEKTWFEKFNTLVNDVKNFDSGASFNEYKIYSFQISQLTIQICRNPIRKCGKL